MSAIVFSRWCHQRQLLRLKTPLVYSRSIHATSARLNVAQKYLEKVRKRAEEEGISVDELKQKVKEAARPAPLPEARKLQEHAKKVERDKKKEDGSSGSWVPKERKDKLPVKPLADIMDVHKVLRTPHTAEQISTIWTAFHASRSGGTGRGYLSASVPLKTYEALIDAGKKYPMFLLPLMHGVTQPESPGPETAYQFYLMQWAFHAAPPIPPPSILDPPLPENALPSQPVHPLATVLFTPLIEYKTHGTFATPHLVLTMYPELAQSHRLVLLRGDLTPSSSGKGSYLLSQQEAQLLALGMQRFYLAHGVDSEENDFSERRKERAALVREFNENPDGFRWEEVLKHADPTS